jgi:hypothetical protein
MAARVTFVMAEDFQAVYVGASLFKQEFGMMFEPDAFCEFLDSLGISVNVIDDDAVGEYLYEGMNSGLPEKLSELNQILAR